jgi:Protein kinase domain
MGTARSSRMGPLARALFVLASAAALTGGGLVLLGRSQRRELSEAAELLKADVGEALRDVQRGLGDEASRAARLRPLRAAIDHEVDDETFRDLLANEAFWAPFRGRLVLVVSDRWELASGPDAPAVRDRDLVGRARRDAPALGWAAGSTRPLATAAIEMPGNPGVRRVLVLGRLLDEGALGAVAERTRAALVVTDGRATLAYAGPPGPRAAAPLGDESGGPRLSDSWLTAPLALLPGRWVWAVRAAPAVPLPQAAPLALFGLAALFAALAVLSRRTPAPAFTPVQAQPGEVGAAAHAGPQYPTQMQPGKVNSFGRYSLIERIGEGGMADLFTAALTGAEGFQRLFVIKRLKPDVAQNKAAIEQFIDEAKLGSLLVHSNIVPTFDFGKVGSGYYLAQEYIAGRNLAQLCARHQERLNEPLSVALTCYLAHEVLDALAYAHARTSDQNEPLNIVHRDISTGNIMATPQGEVKLLDFGIVRAKGRVSSTEHGHIKGNAVFMAPEQARGRPLDGRADLFSLGMVMYYCLTGRPLYEAETSPEVFYQATTGLTADHLARVRALPAPMPEILERALSLDPAGRYPDARTFAEALAPHGLGMKGELATLMSALFGEELRRQTASFQARLSRTTTSAQRG